MKMKVQDKTIAARYQAFLSLSTEAIWRFELEEPIDITLPVKKQIDLMYEHAYLAECNDAMAKMYGLKKASQIEGKRLGELLIRNDENIAYLTAFISHKYRLLDAFSIEPDVKRNEKYFLNNLFGVVEKKKLVRAWGTQRDITDHKKASDLLQYQAQILESISDAVISIDMEYHIKTWNKGAEKLYGWKAREVLGKKIYEVIPATFSSGKRQNVFDELMRVGSWSGEVQQTRKDKKMITIMGSCSLIKNNKGEPIGIVAINRNITDRIQQEKRKDDFISMASHELKTPVTSLKLYSQLLQRQMQSIATLPMQTSLSKMDTQINRLIVLINDLLDISKIQIGKLELRNETFSLYQVVHDVVESLQGTSSHRIEVRGKKSLMLYADQDRIAQVLINFLTNAIKYSPHADRIVVQIRKSGANVVVSVQDFGIGIDKDDQKKIFDRFYQVTSTTKSAAAGLGIGLYISQEIIKRYNGKIWVKSEKGKGSLFSFSLPLLEKKS